jgi:hypothetical protein
MSVNPQSPHKSSIASSWRAENLIDDSGILQSLEMLGIKNPTQDVLLYMESLLESNLQTLIDQPKTLTKETAKYSKELENLICTGNHLLNLENKSFIAAHRVLFD